MEAHGGFLPLSMCGAVAEGAFQAKRLERDSHPKHHESRFVRPPALRRQTAHLLRRCQWSESSTPCMMCGLCLMSLWAYTMPLFGLSNAPLPRASSMDAAGET
ncbi:hypothetical protein FA13DRAFT_1727267 [Coprinellus micaceus]|uniref:Uncharacterized protein n=1 Tax=Coprinellus micaceus TaxID=71717 RepID=A0A4Y7TRT4_COPMI|nr:hypothetical protein FA13DRAFT_1727267 [Coprinellus micaceus]